MRVVGQISDLLERIQERCHRRRCHSTTVTSSVHNNNQIYSTLKVQWQVKTYNFIKHMNELQLEKIS